MKPILQAFFICLLSLGSLHAQYVNEPKDSIKDSELKTYVDLKTTSGDSYDGYLVSQNADLIVLKDIDLNEVYRIGFDSIKEINYERHDNKSDYHYNLQASRYFFGPNAYSLKKGEGYYQNNWVFLNQVSVGLSDRFTLGVGTVPLFIFGYGAPSPVWLTPKFSFPVIPDKLNIAVGGLFGSIWGDDFNNSFGIAYGAITLGNRNRNINLSIGYGMADGIWSDNPTITLSGMARLSRKFYLITENYYISDLVISSFGGRTVWSGVSVDYGLAFLIPTEYYYDEPFGIPWLGLTVPFKL